MTTQDAQIGAALRALVRDLVREELSAATTDTTAGDYTTAPGGPLPPRRSRRWLRDHAREIPGATRNGGMRGRSVVWTVPREAYEAWCASRTMTTSTATSTTAPTATVVDLDGWIAASGHRLTRAR